MQDIAALLRESIAFQQLKKILGSGKSAQIGRIHGSSLAFILSHLIKEISKTCLIVVPGFQDAEDTSSDFLTFGGRQALLLPEIDNPSSPDRFVLSERLRICLEATQKNALIVSSIRALISPVHDYSSLKENVIFFKTKKELKYIDLTNQLASLNYDRVPVVERHGEYAVRGSIIDLFAFGMNQPIRIEFLGDFVESIRYFDTCDQKSTQVIDNQLIYLSRKDISAQGHVLDYIPEDSICVLYNPACIEGKIDPQHRNIISRLQKLQNIIADPVVIPDGPLSINFSVRSLQRFQGQLANLAVELKELLRQTSAVSNNRLPVKKRPEMAHGAMVAPRAPLTALVPVTSQSSWKSVARTGTRKGYVFCLNLAEKQRLEELLKDQKIPKDAFEIRVGNISKGFTFEDAFFVSTRELFNRYQIRRALREITTRDIDLINDFERGDFVVHKDYGIGRFAGIERVKNQDLLAIEYFGGTRLLVPIQDIDRVHRYFGCADAPPPFSKLGTSKWIYTKLEAQKSTSSLARELINLQAKRELLGGYEFPKDDEWQRLFESSFPYDETDDQLKATVELKNDMCSRKPMDRLLCGDVGFGKTELAMRTAFKAVIAGKQVAFLCPTTILAQQHYITFKERFADYPVEIQVLSRFKSQAEQQKTIKALASGSLDIIIGTHRLLGGDIRFKDLGLIIIDEEQRFGVEQKERLKRFRANVDLLTLSATPIPRTLHMSLLSIKDISILATPPSQRLAIVTEVCHFNTQKIRKAILFELERDGQVYFIHNRVESIYEIAQKLSQLIPEAIIRVAHGQMDEDELEQTMLDFIGCKIDVLVATTIIENGIDIPNVNTLIVDNADWFGLSDLHQLRGRVGRYNKQAFAYLLVPRDRPINPDAAKRLKAIEEFSELGSGFKIATRDMEIRGVGNILGREQHGHIKAIGYELYLELLRKETTKLKDNVIEDQIDCSVSLNLEAYISEDYIPDLSVRIEVYKLIARCSTFDTLNKLKSYIKDRFGNPPASMENLFLLQNIKNLAGKHKFTSIQELDSSYKIKFLDRSKAGKLKIIDHETIIVDKKDGVEQLISLLS